MSNGRPLVYAYFLDTNQAIELGFPQQELCDNHNSLIAFQYMGLWLYVRIYPFIGFDSYLTMFRTWWCDFGNRHILMGPVFTTIYGEACIKI